MGFEKVREKTKEGVRYYKTRKDTVRHGVIGYQNRCIMDKFNMLWDELRLWFWWFKNWIPLQYMCLMWAFLLIVAIVEKHKTIGRLL